jgi:hypothetical protein
MMRVFVSHSNHDQRVAVTVSVRLRSVDAQASLVDVVTRDTATSAPARPRRSRCAAAFAATRRRPRVRR